MGTDGQQTTYRFLVHFDDGGSGIRRQTLAQPVDETERRRRCPTAWPQRWIASAAAPMPPSQRNKPIERR